MRITRRQFIKYVSATAAALGVSQTSIERVVQAIANPAAAIDVVWLSGQACGGCIEAASNMFIGGVDVADQNGDNVYDAIPIAQVKSLFAYDPQLANSTTVEDVIINTLDLKLMNVINSPSGDLYTSYLKRYYPGGNLRGTGTPFVVVVEGSVPRDLLPSESQNGKVDYCGIAADYDDPDYKPIGIGRALQELCSGANAAAAVIAYGTCATFGNIPAARNVKYRPASNQYEHTSAMGVQTYLRSKNINTPVVNISVCPGHPEALALTVVDALTSGIPAVAANLDSYGRPRRSLAFPYINLYNRTLHIDCPRLPAYNAGVYSRYFGDTRRVTVNGISYQPCLWQRGCQGPMTSTPCHTLNWNRQFSNTNCVSAGIPCVGCGEAGFPDETLRYTY